MEGHRGRWYKKAPAGNVLLLMCMCMCIPSLQATKVCPPGDYTSPDGNCCNKCPPGFKLVQDCLAEGHRSNCTQCPDGQYSEQINNFRNCHSCKRCKEIKNEILISKCEKHQNTICQCKEGYYKFNIDKFTYECRKCTTCGPNAKEKQTCTPEKNTVCQCKEDYYKVKSKCEPCKNCTIECSHRCSTTSPTLKKEDSPVEHTYLINLIAGVAAVAFILLVLMVVITYMTTKKFTKKKLLKLSSEPTIVSVDSCKVLINVKEPQDNHSVKAVPTSSLSEQESSNLPDCVPLEIKIPDLIYTVLDLVPVQQVKQLVRTLGVKDTEIEQAETDHRSCKEAHYQMLRVWAERGLHGGAGGRGGGGGMLHQPLLEELLDQFRKMHLGRAAEELEAIYRIQ